MKIPRLTKGDLVEIIWSDTNIPGDSPGWMTEKELSSFLNSNGGIVKSVGIYNGKSKNRKYIQLVGDTDGDDIPDKSSLRPINIAVGYIIQVYQLIRVDVKEVVKHAKKNAGIAQTEEQLPCKQTVGCATHLTGSSIDQGGLVSQSVS